MLRHSNRLLFVGFMILFIFFGLICRLSYIQLFGTESFGSQHVNLIKDSIKQRTHGIILNDGRGELLDKNGKFLYKSTKLSLILFPFLKQIDWPIGKLAGIIHRDPKVLQSAIKKANEPFAFDQAHLNLTKKEVNQINKLNVPGVFALPMTVDKSEHFAPQLIGMVKQNPNLVKSRYSDLLKVGAIDLSTPIGISGLQEAFDPFLTSKDDTELLYHTSSSGLPIFGPHVKYSAPANPYFPLNVKTTIDKELQTMAEKAGDAVHLRRGGIVLLDARTSNLLAMVSRPTINESNPYANGTGNLMLEPQFPGSVFKIVTATAALEHNAIQPNEWFDCNLNVYGDGPSDRQLGSLTFDQSFSRSCNLTFANLAVQLMKNHPHILNDTAQSLGLTQKVGWTDDVYHLSHFEQFPEEKKNIIWKNNSDRKIEKAVRQTAIGQLNVKITPLSMANLMATIARGGEKMMVRDATEVVHKDQSVIVTFPHKKIPGASPSPYTMMQLQKLLREVVTDPSGTGHSLADLPYPVAGKSGTAQTGQGHYNQWFAGYFPADNPRYAMVVVDLDQKPGENKTYEIYASLVRSLFQYDQQHQNE